MAFPPVETTAVSVEATSVTAHTVTMPSGIVSGNLIIIMFAYGASNVEFTWPTGFTEMFKRETQAFAKSAASYKQSDGTEGASLTVTTNVSVKSAHNTYRISGHEDPATQAPESNDFHGVFQPDPPNLIPTGGAKDYLWLAWASSRETNDMTAAPTSYTDRIEQEGSVADDPIASSARRQLNAASENPGAFTLSSDDQNSRATFAIHPGAPVVVAAIPAGVVAGVA